MVNKLPHATWHKTVCREIEVLRLSSSLTLTCTFNSSAVLTREPQLSNDNCVISADTLCEKWHELWKTCAIVSLSMPTNYQPRNRARETSKVGILLRLWVLLSPLESPPPVSIFCEHLNTGYKRSANWCWLVYSLCTCVLDRTPWRWCSSVCGRTAGRSWAQPLGSRGTFEPSTWGKPPVVSQKIVVFNYHPQYILNRCEMCWNSTASYLNEVIVIFFLHKHASFYDS